MGKEKKDHRIALVIDDEPLIRKALRRALQARSFQVFEAEDGDEGLKRWQMERPHLVFLDILMPRVSGPEVLRQMTDRLGAKVILISAYSGSNGEHEKYKQIVDCFIAKPFEDIFEVVNLAEGLLNEAIGHRN